MSDDRLSFIFGVPFSHYHCQDTLEQGSAPPDCTSEVAYLSTDHTAMMWLYWDSFQLRVGVIAAECAEKSNLMFSAELLLLNTAVCRISSFFFFANDFTVG